MAITWSKCGLGMVPNLNTQGKFPVYQDDSVSKMFRILPSWKEKIGQTGPQHGPNMALAWSSKLNIAWPCPLDQVKTVMKISKLYLFWK